MPNHRFGRRPSARVELKLVPSGVGTYQVLAITRADRHRSGHGSMPDPIGSIKKGASGAWLHSGWPSTHLGPVYGHSPTKEKAAQECYRSYRAWIGF